MTPYRITGVVKASTMYSQYVIEYFLNFCHDPHIHPITEVLYHNKHVTIDPFIVNIEYFIVLWSKLFPMCFLLLYYRLPIYDISLKVFACSPAILSLLLIYSC